MDELYALNHEIRNAILSIRAMLIILGKNEISRDKLIAMENIKEQCKRIIFALDAFNKSSYSPP